MPSYISLAKFTDQGIRDIKNSTNRLKAFEQAAERMGVEVKAVYYTVGRYDMVVICDAPDIDTISALALTTGSQGNVSTQSLVAFSPDEMDGIIAKML